jgi:hypothetical protein
MGKPSRIGEMEALIREIQRYLAFVDALRKRPAPQPPGAGEKRS